MAWAHVLSKASAMGNPHEYRELMKAVFGYSNKTASEVLAEQKARHEEGRPSRKKTSSTAAPTSSAPRPSEVEKMKALLAMGKPRPVPAEE